MKTLFMITLLVVLVAAGAANAQFDNRIGVYATPTPLQPEPSVTNPETSIYAWDPGFLDLHLVCVNPHNTATDSPIHTLGGYELNVDVQLGWYLHSVTLPPDILDLDGANDAFYCSGFVPVTTHGNNRIALLATLRLGHLDFDPGMGFVYVVPYFVAPSIPDHMAVTDAFDNYSLQAVEPSSWDHGVPVCLINYWWDTVEERAWGDVKALYR